MCAPGVKGGFYVGPPRGILVEIIENCSKQPNQYVKQKAIQGLLSRFRWSRTTSIFDICLAGFELGSISTFFQSRTIPRTAQTRTMGLYSRIEHHGDRQTTGDWQFEVILRLGRKITSNCEWPMLCLSQAKRTSARRRSSDRKRRPKHTPHLQPPRSSNH